MIAFLEKNRYWLRPSLLFLYLGILLLPGYVFFSQRGGFEILQQNNFKTFASLFFPIFGLYAFTLVWTQTMIGMNMINFTKLFGSILNFHRYQGLFALLFATTHSLAVTYVFTIQEYIGFKFLAPEMRIFGLLGAIAFYLLILTVLVAVFRRAKALRKFWRYIHYLNYLIFLLVLVHSRNLGSDIQGTILDYLWNFFLITFLVSLVFRVLRNFNKGKHPVPSHA